MYQDTLKRKKKPRRVFPSQTGTASYGMKNVNYKRMKKSSKRYIRMASKSSIMPNILTTLKKYIVSGDRSRRPDVPGPENLNKKLPRL